VRKAGQSLMRRQNPWAAAAVEPIAQPRPRARTARWRPEPPFRFRRRNRMPLVAALIAAAFAGASLGVVLPVPAWVPVIGRATAPAEPALTPIYRPDPPARPRQETPRPLPPAGGWVVPQAQPSPAAPMPMPLCSSNSATSCVIDGDTIRHGGETVRLADIDTPEINPPRCAAEAQLGLRARDRLRELLGAGSFELAPASGPDRDAYGRQLRILLRDGRSVGDQLVAEGLARSWTGQRDPWC
jgi:endonuclease YncB( thermonuclease family)